MSRPLAVSLAALGVLAAGFCAPEREPVALSITQLDNGMRLYVRRYDAAPTVGVAMSVAVSAFDEPEGWEGIRQLAQMCLLDQAKASLLRAGVMLDGEVQLDFLTLRAWSLPTLWQRAVTALLDAAFHVHFDTMVVRTEQAVMRRMEAEAAAAPAVVASRAGIQALYPSVARCGRAAVAWRPAATTYVQRFCRQHFRPNKVALAVSGAVDAEQVAKFVERATANLMPGALQSGAGAPAAPPRLGRVRLRVPGEGAAVWVGARMPKADDRDYPAAVVTAAVIGGGMGSRAFRRLRDELSLVYTVGSQMVASQRCPHAYVMCTCRPEDAERVADELESMVENLADEGPSDQEVARAREYVSGQAAQLAMSNWQAATFITAMAVIGDGKPWARGPSALAGALAAVTAADVRSIARNWWTRRTTILVMGR